MEILVSRLRLLLGLLWNKVETYQRMGGMYYVGHCIAR